MTNPAQAAGAADLPMRVQDMARRKPRKELELVWRGAKSFGAEADIFMGNFPDGADLAAFLVSVRAAPDLSRQSACCRELQSAARVQL